PANLVNAFTSTDVHSLAPSRYAAHAPPGPQLLDIPDIPVTWLSARGFGHLGAPPPGLPTRRRLCTSCTGTSCTGEGAATWPPERGRPTRRRLCKSGIEEGVGYAGRQS